MERKIGSIFTSSKNRERKKVVNDSFGILKGGKSEKQGGGRNGILRRAARWEI